MGGSQVDGRVKRPLPPSLPGLYGAFPGLQMKWQRFLARVGLPVDMPQPLPSGPLTGVTDAAGWPGGYVVATGEELG